MRVTLNTRRKIALPLAASALWALSFAGCAPNSSQFTMPRWGRGEIDGPTQQAMGGAPSRSSSSQTSVDDMLDGPREAGRRASESMKAAWGRASDSFTQAVSFESKSSVDENDPTGLNTPVGPIDPELFVQAARLAEQNGDLAAAASQYERALSRDPKNRKALIGYARLNDRQDDLPQAISLYQQAIREYPQDAVAYNDLGLCYTLHGRTSEGLTLLGKAVELDPENPRYRNNIAIVLVDLERYDEALTQLRNVHGPAEAHHNLACLLNARGQQDLANQHFAMAQQMSRSAATPPVQPPQQQQAQAPRYPSLGPATGMPQGGTVQGVSIEMGPPQATPPVQSSQYMQPSQPVQVSPSSQWQGYSPEPTSPAAGSVRTADLNQQSAVSRPTDIEQVQFAYDDRPLAESCPGDSAIDSSVFGTSGAPVASPEHLPPVR